MVCLCVRQRLHGILIFKVSGDMRKIHFCFRIIKEKYLNSQTRPKTKEPTQSKINDYKLTQDEGNLQVHRMGVESDLLTMDVTRLRGLLQQRDEEINVIVKLLKQEKSNFAETQRSLFSLREKYIEATGQPFELKMIKSVDFDLKRPLTDPTLSASKHTSLPIRESISEEAMTRKRSEFSKARKTAFETFRKRHPQEAVLNQHNTRLNECYSKAKILGEKVNASRLQINKLKTQIQYFRVSNSVEPLANEATLEEENSARDKLEICRVTFKRDCASLKDLRTEIEHIQHLMEKIKVHLLKEFDSWWAEQIGSYKNSILEGDNNRDVALSMEFPASKLRETARPADKVLDETNQNFYTMKQEVINKRTK